MLTTPILTLDDAKRIAAAAEKFANDNGFKVVICIVDAGGRMLYLQRPHDVQFGSVEVALGKAFSAIAFKRPTFKWEEKFAQPRLGYLQMPQLTGLQGGLPLTVGGEFVGGIGVSGVDSADDERIAQAGVDELARIAQAGK